MSEKLNCEDCGKDLILVGYIIGIDYKIRCPECYMKRYGVTGS